MVLFLHSRAKLLLLVLNWTLFSPVLADTVTVPLTAPSSAQALSRSLVSFSLEQDRWVDWIGQGAENSFFLNTLDNLNGLAGEPPRIRMGGNSVDRTVFDSSVQARSPVGYELCPAGSHKRSSQIVIFLIPHRARLIQRRMRTSSGTTSTG
jgi:hypothetical protein